MTQEPTHDVHEDEVHDHDRGLSFDVSTLMTRRRALQLARRRRPGDRRGLRVVVERLVERRPRPRPRPTAPATGRAGTTAEIPEETAGPFPADGSNGVNVLTESGIVRSDITSSFGSASGDGRGRAAGDRADDPRRVRRGHAR